MLTSVLLGTVVGLISSVLGLGGGILLVPLLPVMTDLSRKESVLVSLCSIFFIVSVNTYFFYKEGKVNLKAVFGFGPLTAIGSIVAAYFISPLLTESLLKNILATVLLIWGVFNLYKLKKEQVVKAESAKHFFSFMLLSLVAGILSGLLGIGSGLILSLMLVGLSWVKSDHISPTSNGIMIFTTFFAVVAYLFKTDLSVFADHLQIYVLPIVVSAMVTAYWGRKFQAKLDRKVRGYILVALLLMLSLKTFIAQS